MLVEVSLGIHETCGHQGQAKNAGVFQVIPGKKIQPPCIKREGVLETIFCEKIDNGKVTILGKMFGKPAVFPVHFLLDREYS